MRATKSAQIELNSYELTGEIAANEIDLTRRESTETCKEMRNRHFKRWLWPKIIPAI
jgi:hypothetical protein